MTLKEVGYHGRIDGKKQLGSIQDQMRYRFGFDWRYSPFPTQDHMNAYITGFYRACGYPGSSNQRQRKYATSRSV